MRTENSDLDPVNSLQIVSAYRDAIAQDDDDKANWLRMVWELRHGEDSLHEAAFGKFVIE